MHHDRSSHLIGSIIIIIVNKINGGGEGEGVVDYSVEMAVSAESASPGALASVAVVSSTAGGGAGVGDATAMTDESDDL